jgi:concentrative nucleoside transporter, CNT family
MEMHRFTGLLGIIAILGLAYLFSNNRQRINWRLIGTGLAIQVLLAVFVLKSPIGQAIIQVLSDAIQYVLSFSQAGADFVFGALGSRAMLAKTFGADNAFIFALDFLPKIIFVAALVSISYYVGLMQRVVQGMAWLMTRVMAVSGTEALSNVASVFVGQIEAQLMIRPYVATMTNSELMASMSGSLACIAGSIMAVYISMGIPAEYLLTASIMAAPGALVISKLMHPETQTSQTLGKDITLVHEQSSVNIVDAAAHGASDGMKIGLQVITMLIGFLSLIALLNGVLSLLGSQLYSWGVDLSTIGLDIRLLNLQNVLSIPFSVLAFLIGVPWHDALDIGGLLGTKLVANEFVAYKNYLGMAPQLLSGKTQAITTVALCGFANFGSVAMQIGGIGEMAPERKTDLAKLGLRALAAGSMASYLSAAIVGVLI